MSDSPRYSRVALLQRLEYTVSMSDINDLVAGKIRRIARGVMTQNQLANKVGLSSGLLSAKMTGQSRFSLSQIYRVAEALKVHPFDLLPDPEDLE